MLHSHQCSIYLDQKGYDGDSVWIVNSRLYCTKNTVEKHEVNLKLKNRSVPYMYLLNRVNVSSFKLSKITCAMRFV